MGSLSILVSSYSQLQQVAQRVTVTDASDATQFATAVFVV